MYIDMIGICAMRMYDDAYEFLRAVSIRRARRLKCLQGGRKPRTGDCRVLQEKPHFGAGYYHRTSRYAARWALLSFFSPHSDRTLRAFSVARMISYRPATFSFGAYRYREFGRNIDTLKSPSFSSIGCAVCSCRVALA